MQKGESGDTETIEVLQLDDMEEDEVEYDPYNTATGIQLSIKIANPSRS